MLTYGGSTKKALLRQEANTTTNCFLARSMLTQTTPLNISKNFKQATEKTSKLTASSKLSNRNPATEALSRSFQNDFYSVTPEDLYQQKKTTKLIPLLTPGHLDGNEPCCTLQPPETLSPPEPRIWWPCSNSICEITKALLPLQQTGWESRSQRSPRTASYRQRGLGGGFFFPFSSSNLEFLV